MRRHEVVIDVVDDGVLWLMNRVIFHPRGFTLAYHPEREAHERFTLTEYRERSTAERRRLEDELRLVHLEALLSHVRKHYPLCEAEHVG